MKMFVIGLIVLAMVNMVGSGLLNRGRGGMHVTGPTLVLRRFKIDESPSAIVLVDIVGRTSGIIAFLLTVIGLSTETILKVTDKEVTFKGSSLFGETHQVVPLAGVASTHCGYSKPIGYLIIGVIFLLYPILSYLGLGPNIQSLSGILPFWVFGAIFLLVYFLYKKIFISLETNGGMVLNISFKRSVIENVSVDMEQALKVIQIINQKVIESQVK